MGREVAYQPCPNFPKSPGCEMKKIPPVVGALLSAALLVMVVLYAVQVNSDPARELWACQSQLQNQSAQIAELERREKEAREAARREAQGWSQQLETAHKTLAGTQEKWQSCQARLNDLEKNFTSLEATANMWKDEIKSRQKQLDDEQRKNKEERGRLQAEIEQLNKQIAQRQSDNSNGGWDFAGPSITLLTIMIAGSLST